MGRKLKHLLGIAGESLTVTDGERLHLLQRKLELQLTIIL